MFDWVLNMPLTSLICVIYQTTTRIKTISVSCDQVNFAIGLYVLFQYVYLVKHKADEMNRITFLNKKLFSSYVYS